MTIQEHIIENYGFKAIRFDKEFDIDKFSAILRIGDIHYLFWSTHHKYFTIGLKHENPKGTPGKNSKVNYWTHMMIPKPIYTIEEADMLVQGICNFEYMKCIAQ